MKNTFRERLENILYPKPISKALIGKMNPSFFFGVGKLKKDFNSETANEYYQSDQSQMVAKNARNLN